MDSLYFRLLATPSSLHPWPFEAASLSGMRANIRAMMILDRHQLPTRVPRQGIGRLAREQFELGVRKTFSRLPSRYFPFWGKGQIHDVSKLKTRTLRLNQPRRGCVIQPRVAARDSGPGRLPWVLGSPKAQPQRGCGCGKDGFPG